MSATYNDAVAARSRALVPLQRGTLQPTPQRQLEQLTRRSIDIIGSLLLLAILLPVLVLVAIAIKVTTGGPVFYSQGRVGRDGRLFPFLKFRTMIPGADSMRAEILGTPDGDMPERYRSDPRITPIGAVLRRWSIDELPQLLNVLRGDMSLVGPRPILPEELPLLAGSHHRRHDCRPGLTGLWQVSGRKETTWTERMDLDLRYVDSQSIMTDLSLNPPLNRDG